MLSIQQLENPVNKALPPSARPAPNRAAPPAIVQLSGPEKAAVIVRLLLSEGDSLPLSSLPEHLQAALTEQMGKMRLVDRDTLSAVVAEFLGQIEDVGLTFPGGIDGALTLLDGHISSSAATRMRRMSGASSKIDPWDRITHQSDERLRILLSDEAVEVGAILLSKLNVTRAAELLGKLPGERARRLAHAISQTSQISPDVVRRVGLALGTQLEAMPPPRLRGWCCRSHGLDPQRHAPPAARGHAQRPA